MAVLRQIEMTGPEEAVAIDAGSNGNAGVIDFVNDIFFYGIPGLRLEVGGFDSDTGVGWPYVEYAREDGSDINEPNLSVTLPLLIGGDTGNGAVGLIEFRDAGGDVKLVLVWQTAGNQLQLWSAGYAGIVTGTTSQPITAQKLYWAQITAGTGASASVRLRLYDEHGALIFDSGTRTADTGTTNYARIRYGCLERHGSEPGIVWFAGPTTITDGEQIAPDEELQGELTVYEPIADTEVAGTSTNNNQNTNFGSNTANGAGRFGSVNELVRGLERHDLSQPTAGPPVHTGRIIHRARLRRIVHTMQQPASTRAYSLHVMTAEWKEDEATGIVRLTGVPWSGGECAEGDFEPTPFATHAGPTTVGEVIHIDVTERVQEIVAGGGTILDCITKLQHEFEDGEGTPLNRTAHMWHSREATDPTMRCVLLVESEPAPTPPGDGGRSMRSRVGGFRSRLRR